MRNTLDIDDDLLFAAHSVAEEPAFYGFDPLPARHVVVTNDFIDRLRDETGD